MPEGTLAVAVWVGDAGESPPTSIEVHPREEGKVRGRDGVLLRDGQVVATHLDLPWQEDDPATGSARRRMRAGSCSPAASGPDNVRAAMERVRPWAVDASSRLESSPGVKDHATVRAYVEAARG